MSKTLKDKEYVVNWYQERVQQFGNDIRSLGFNQRSSQIRRFEALLKLGDFSGHTLLDVGCGLGDFYDFLLNHGISPIYKGVDITPGMIDQCKIRFADQLGRSCSFETADSIEYAPETKFDFVVASGIFGLWSENVEDRIIPTLERLFSLCTQGAAINFLSSQSRKQAPGRLYVDPPKLLKMALELTPAVELSHSYLPNDFTLFLYRTPSWRKDEENMRNGKAALAGLIA